MIWNLEECHPFFIRQGPEAQRNRGASPSGYSLPVLGLWTSLVVTAYGRNSRVKVDDWAPFILQFFIFHLDSLLPVYISQARVVPLYYRRLFLRPWPLRVISLNLQHYPLTGNWLEMQVLRPSQFHWIWYTEVGPANSKHSLSGDSRNGSTSGITLKHGVEGSHSCSYQGTLSQVLW